MRQGNLLFLRIRKTPEVKLRESDRERWKKENAFVVELFFVKREILCFWGVK